MRALLRKLGIASWLLIPGAIAIALIAASSGLALLAIGSQRDATAEARKAADRLILATEIERRVIDLETGVRAYALVRQARFLVPSESAISSLPRLRQAVIESERAHGDDLQVRALQRLFRRIDSYTDQYVEPSIAWLQANPAARLSAVSLSEGKRRVDGLRRLLTEYQRVERREADVSRDRVDAATSRAVVFAIGGLLGIALLVAVVVLAFSRRVASPLRHLSEAARRMRDGDLDARVDAGGPAEVRELASSFNGMAESLRDGRRELERRNAELAGERDLSRRFDAYLSRLAGETDLSRLGNALLDELGAVVGAETGALYALDPDDREGRRLELIASRGSRPAELPDTLASEREVSALDGLRVPLAGRERLLGVVLLDGPDEEELDEEERERLAQMARPATVTLAAALAAETTERALRLNEAILTASRDAYVAVDVDGIVVGWSEQATEIFGYTEEEMRGRTIAEILLPPEERAAHHERRRKLMEDGGQSEPYLIWVTVRDGRRVLCEIHAAVARGPWRTICTYIVRDVTAREMREEELRAEEAVGRALVGSKGDDGKTIEATLAAIGESLGWPHGSYWEYDERERVLRCVRHWSTPERRSEQVERTMLRARVAIDDRRGLFPLFPRAWHSGEVEWEPIVNDPGEGIGRWERSAVEAAGLGGAVAVPIGVGERRLGVFSFGLESRERPSEARLFALKGIADLVGQVLERRRVERESEELKNEFFALVSHELRTPLTSLIGYLDIVRDEEAGEINDEQRRFLGVADRNAHRLMRLVGDLLFVAQVEAGTLQLEPRPTELDAIALDAVEAARPRADRAQVELSAEVEPVAIESGDPDRLGQLVDNLVSNALKFTPPGGTVRVGLRRDGDRAVLEVADSGVGIAPADLEHLFDRFFRTEGAYRDAIPGLGLGLSICKAIAEGHGGSIAVSSEEGVGTTFSVTLPLSPTVAEPGEDGRGEIETDSRMEGVGE